MSKITGSEVRGLMEAYGAVYAPQQLTEEQIWEEVETWVNSLMEEGYDLSDYTWEEMYEAYITEIGVNFGGQAAVDRVRTQAAAERQSRSRIDALRQQRFGGPSATPTKTSSQQSGMYGRYDYTGGKKPSTTPAAKPSPTPAAPAARTPGGAPRPAATPAARPSGGAPAAAKPAPSPAAQTGDKSKDMATWAKANPSLATAAAEKARIRGTQQTDNPLMKDMKSRLPMNSPSVQSPDVAKLGKGNQSLVSNPNAFKAVTPSAAIKAAPSTSAAASGSVTAPTAKIAAAPKPTPVAPKATPLGSSKPGSRFEHLDLFDIVKGHLLDEGYADTEEAAEAIMASMSEEWRKGIISELAVGGQSPRLPTSPQSKKSKPEIPPKNPLPKGPQPGGYGTGFGG